ncbi:unnamed protein product (macronuclear) [Paramecium tetraurelia]|uniref:WD40-repeat-containing domain n=1 Tax=Paramecium tetraurelia TaxID=5888 RepID=A0BH42_PARTE|nr:uncharacterized protein GSPATT00028894001 [Paramecium tetraurelia]CAK57859.1 unnamed protein product [Paramecium tetraurelia]|eukprot:XP_001425257.1 hypothetical protein (macronuclear) [Paramecium tetraurelia strain d4-2]
METNQNILQQDQENDLQFICTSSQCKFRGCTKSRDIQSKHKNCNVLPYKEFVESIENYTDQIFPSETFKIYDQKLKQYLKKINKLQEEVNDKSLMFNKIKKELNNANVQKNKLQQLLQQFKDKTTQLNFELLEKTYQSSKQQKTIDNVQRNQKKIDHELTTNQFRLAISQVEFQDDDQSSDEDSSDDESSDDQSQRISNQQLDPEVQELENKYNQAFNFLRNNAITQVKQNKEEQLSQLQEQIQSQQYEEQTNIKFIEKFGNNSILVATKSQLGIYDLISKSLQWIKQVDTKITSLQVTNFEQVIVVGKKDGNIEVLEWNSESKDKLNSSNFRVSNEEGRLFVEKLQPRHIACLGRDGNCKIYETPNFNVVDNYKLDQGTKIVPTCFFAISEQQFIIGAEKTLFFNKTKIEYKFNGKIKQICQFGNRWLVADKATIYILVQNGELISVFKEYPFSPKQIIYMTTFYESQFIYINTKSSKSDDYQNQVATIQTSGEQLDLQLQQLDKNIQVKLLKGYQNKNETFLYGIDGSNIKEYKMIRENDKFIVL